MLLLAVAATALHAQSVPAADGSDNAGLPLPRGSLHYSLRYTDAWSIYQNEPDQQLGTLHGRVAYDRPDRRYPLNIDYGASYSWDISGPPYATGLGQGLTIDQRIFHRHWILYLPDNCTYEPESVTEYQPNFVPDEVPTLLSVDSHVIQNVATPSLDMFLTGSTWFTLGSELLTIRFPKGNGLDTDEQSGNAQLRHNFDLRNDLFLSYAYTRFSYSSMHFVSQVQDVQAGYARQWNWRLRTSAAAGPQWISSEDRTVVPSSLRLSVNVSVVYSMRSSDAGIAYYRSANSGQGFMLGAEVDSVTGHLSHQFGRNTNITLSGAYDRTNELDNRGLVNTEYGDFIYTRKLTRFISTYASYVGMDQSTRLHLSGTPLNELIHQISVGVSFSPRQLLFKH